ncbi:MAG: tRNA (adenosine(37)-N6)-threonylcarbamoyltransferase complex dimerization subunit type 1 TsaB [Ruminococcus sp.]|nr:tRNA (adenosine(37)-N6)-threonylcarbamoyltransferase complex dimerization subunit type 1 TsaB [Ruminococcus sp.]
MRILGIDTSGTVAAAALYDSDTDLLLGQQLVYTKRTHSQVILPLVQRILEDTGLTLSDVDRMAAAAGPGSYTGLRIGIAAVKAMSFALKIPCCGISTLEALAWQAHLAGEDTVCAVMKARKGLVYAGMYHFSGESCQILMQDQLLPEQALLTQLQELDGAVTLTGDGGAAFLEEHSQLEALLAPAMVRLQNGCGLCRAALHHEGISPEQLEAEYLQLVKAEKDRLDKMM